MQKQQISSKVHTFLSHSGARYPIICGAMYPCSNPELVAAASEAGGIGVFQPISLTYAHGYSFSQGLEYLKTLSSAPMGMNVIVEKSVRMYERTMMGWVDEALQAGVRFFVTSLGNPRWVVERAHKVGGYVYHDVTSRRWADKALEAGVDGLIAVNNRAGGHVGEEELSKLYESLTYADVPIIAAGGIATGEQVKQCLDLGYAGVQLGTRFIVSKECSAHDDYKQAILKAQARDIVYTKKISGVPVSVINTPYVQKIGTEVSWLSAKMLRHPKMKHWIRSFWALKSLRSLSRSSLRKKRGYQGYWQAGKSVEHIHKVLSVKEIMQDLVVLIEAEK